jgi:hypothetical protein
MPIRLRNKLWQADVITPTGQRVRKSFGTKSQAAQFVRDNANKLPKKQPRLAPSQACSGPLSLTSGSAQIAESQQKPSSQLQEDSSLRH